MLNNLMKLKVCWSFNLLSKFLKFNLMMETKKDEERHVDREEPHELRVRGRHPELKSSKNITESLVTTLLNH